MVHHLVLLVTTKESLLPLSWFQLEEVQEVEVQVLEQVPGQALELVLQVPQQVEAQVQALELEQEQEPLLALEVLGFLLLLSP